jgi:hypothetical protein
VSVEDISVEVGVDQNVLISKPFGPLGAEDVRVRLEWPGDWVVERLSETTGKWEEKIRWSCQESYPSDDESDHPIHPSPPAV